MESDKTPQQIGNGMWLAAWLILMGILCVYFEDLIQEKYDPNHALSSDGSGEVILKRNRQGHYVAPGLINGKPVVFLLDTGATTISVPKKVADNIGLIGGYKQQVGTANGMIEVYQTRLDTVSLGGITLNDIQGHINPHMDSNTVLLGMSFMRNLEIIQKGDTLTLRR